MRVTPARLTALPLAGVPLAGLGVLTAQVLYAAHRRLPHFTDLDPSGAFGDPDAPLLRVVALGDSSITGPGLDDPDPIWVRRVARHLSARYRVELISLAVGGSRVRDVLEEQLPTALDLRPHLALLSAGANDALRGTPTWRLERELEEIVQRLIEGGMAVAMLGVGDLGTIPRLPIPLSLLARYRARRVDRIEGRVAARHPGVAKGEAWSSETSRAFRERPDLFAPDLFHVSARGHRVWADLAIPAVETALSEIEADRAR